MAKDTDSETITLTLPEEGRIINSSLFEKDQYDDKSTASYKIELAYTKNPEVLAPVFEALLAAADAKWGKNCGDLNVDGGNIISGIIDGEVLARKREAKGKKGDAYKGMWVIRANTIYNLHGVDGPGGIQVFDEDVKAIGPAAQGVIYPGCYAAAAVSIGYYEDEKTGNHAMKFYLSGVQKTKDGERLVTAKDASTLFRPVGRAAAPAGAAAGGRARRAG